MRLLRDCFVRPLADVVLHRFEVTVCKLAKGGHSPWLQGALTHNEGEPVCRQWHRLGTQIRCIAARHSTDAVTDDTVFHAVNGFATRSFPSVNLEAWIVDRDGW